MITTNDQTNTGTAVQLHEQLQVPGNNFSCSDFTVDDDTDPDALAGCVTERGEGYLEGLDASMFDEVTK